MLLLTQPQMQLAFIAARAHLAHVQLVVSQDLFHEIVFQPAAPSLFCWMALVSPKCRTLP